MSSHIYLTKDNANLTCHCKCDNALITFPPQMDCPWCGCGWLFTCIECRKAFTFARGVEVDESWEDLAVRDLTNQWGKNPSPKDVNSWVESMKELLADIEVGGQYICLDGAFIPVEADAIDFTGWHSRHNLPYVPQVAALKDKSVVQQVLSNVEYWQASALAEE
jgi:hypothetical protein